MKLYSSMLGTFFVYTLTLSMPIFKKKIFEEISGQMTPIPQDFPFGSYRLHFYLKCGLFKLVWGFGCQHQVFSHSKNVNDIIMFTS